MEIESPPRPFAMQQEELFLFLLQHIPDRIYFKDERSRFLWGSDAMAKFLGVETPADLVGRSDFDFFTREHAQQAFDDEQAVMLSGEAMIGKIEKETLPGGRTGWAMTTKIPLRNPDGIVVGTCGISRDFTVQKALEESLARTNAECERNQIELEKALAEVSDTHAALEAARRDLLEAEKMRARARFVFGIAGHLRKPLDTVQRTVRFLETQIGSSGDFLSTLDDALQQADAVISALMDATDASGLQLTPSALEPILRSAAALPSGSPDVVVTFEIEPNLFRVRADPAKLEQCFRGIVRNAMDAMPGGGRVRIHLRRVTLRGADVAESAGLRMPGGLTEGSDAAEVRISDTGPGIRPEILANLFDPLRNTRPKGQGTGLGLIVCRKIIELHHGTLRIENDDHGGVTARILLPFVAE